jgi:hypothetical protein
MAARRLAMEEAQRIANAPLPPHDLAREWNSLLHAVANMHAATA